MGNFSGIIGQGLVKDSTVAILFYSIILIQTTEYMLDWEQKHPDIILTINVTPNMILISYETMYVNITLFRDFLYEETTCIMLCMYICNKYVSCMYVCVCTYVCMCVCIIIVCTSL